MPDIKTVDVTVFVPRGPAREGEILKAALMAAQGEIPMGAIGVKPAVVSASDVLTDEDGTEGRNYLVRINWEPRGVVNRFAVVDEDTPKGTVDEVLQHLQPLTADDVDDVLEGTDA